MPFSLEELRSILEQNQRDLALLNSKVDKIRRRLTVATVFDTIKFIIIVVPLLLGLWYFQPMFKTIIQTSGTLLQNLQSFNSTNDLNLAPSSVEALRQQLYPPVSP